MLIVVKTINLIIALFFRYPGPGEEFHPDSDAALVTNVYKNSGPKSNTGKQSRDSLGN